MFFNSIDFALFLPIVFTLYWSLNKSLKLQNLLILIASYVFYGWWDWRFLFLIFLSSLLDFTIGCAFSSQKVNTKWKSRLLLGLSVGVNLGLLGFFKYYNFFIESFAEAFSLFGRDFPLHSLDLILPVGISFYTFQTMSYTIDVYRGELKPTRDFISFFAFVSFFPQLVAGPIERASNLLPQFYSKRKFDKAKAEDGLRQILWGLFKKVVIADNCATMVDVIFKNPTEQSGLFLLLGAFFFAFQIYGDFSGYSDIAIGSARLFGFNLKKNFAVPYFSRDVAEFWRRWHISLTTWFRDYLYIPLGGSRGGKWLALRNTIIVFLVSGFWHGANWTFIVWGALNAIYFIPLLLFNKNRRYLGVVAEKKAYPSIREFFSMISTFVLISISWIFFRANSLKEAFIYLKSLFENSFWGVLRGINIERIIEVCLLLLFFIVLEWKGRRDAFALERCILSHPRYLRWAFYYFLLFVLFINSGGNYAFIYFQF